VTLHRRRFGCLAMKARLLAELVDPEQFPDCNVVARLVRSIAEDAQAFASRQKI
jgi:hypothetical protein